MRLKTEYRSMLWFATALLLFLAIAALSLGTQEISEPASAEKDPALQKLDNVKALLKDGSYADAEKLAREILAEVEAKHGVESLQAAQVLDVLVESILRSKMQVDDESQALAERAISIRERALGPEHAKVVKSLKIFTTLFRRTGDYAGAKSLLERALVKAEKAYSPNHIEVAGILNNLGILHRETRDYARAREFLERALRIREKEFGPEHLVVANTLNNIGLILHDAGDLAEAKSCFERTLAIRKKVLGLEHKSVALAAANLGGLLHTMGAYAEAKILYERTLSILEKEFGPEHPTTANCLNDLGYLLKDMGEFTIAMQCHERALAIREKAYGDKHPLVAYSLNNLAVVLRHLGDYERTRMLLERSLAILEKVFGPDHPSVAMPLNNLANLLDNMGDYEGAETYIRRAFEIQEKALGPNNVKLVPYLVNYSIELNRLGNLDKAKELQQRAFLIQEKNLGPDHPDLATILIDLASLHHDTGESEKAISLIERAQVIAEKSAGPNHPHMAKILRDFSTYLWYEGQTAEALKKALRSEEIVRDRLRLITKSLSERQALAYASEKAYWGLDICLSMAVKRPEEITSKVWDAFIRSRALVLDEMAARNRIVIEKGDPEVAALAESLSSARQRLADLVVRGPNPNAPEENYQNLLDEARNEKEQAERALAKASTSFKEELERSQTGLAEVKASLPPGFALVAFACYYHHELHQKEEEQEKREGAADHEQVYIPYYLAFVLEAQKGKPTIVPLGRIEEIDPLIFDWGQEAASGTRIPGRSAKESETAYRAAGEALRRKVWDPIAPHLGKIRRVILVPDGALHVVNFSALPVGSEKYLIESGPQIHYLSAERDLISLGESPVRGTGLLALGDPAFDETSLFAALSPEGKPKKGILAKVKSFFSFRGMRSTCGDFKSLKFTPLPAAHKEIKEIASIWKKGQESKGDVLNLTGDMASERAFKMAAPGKQILHLATHGFFLEGECPSALAPSEKQQGSGREERGELPPISGENPLLLTGLALAGANHREAARPEEEDGILTAEEVAALDLSGVDWVVLSACDTGVGEIRGGEGVFGLRRAFRLAGAQTLITSLWAVEDEAARKWMRALYKAHFSKGLRTAESVREASLEVLRDLRKRRKSTHPFYWAGFVASGDWR